jgi:hypothetical protein
LEKKFAQTHPKQQNLQRLTQYDGTKFWRFRVVEEAGRIGWQNRFAEE